MQSSFADLSKKYFFTLLIVTLFLYLIHPFSSAILWSCLLSITLSPLQKFIQRHLKIGRLLSGLVCLIVFIGILLCPVFILVSHAAHEASRINIQTLKALFDQLKNALSTLPFLGDQLRSQLHSDQLIPLAKSLLSHSTNYINGVGHSLSIFFISLIMTLLFTFLMLVNQPIIETTGNRINRDLLKQHNMTIHDILSNVRAITISLVSCGLINFIIMSIVYACFGLNNPLLLGLITGLTALIPFMLPLFYAGLGLFFLINHLLLSSGIFILIVGLSLNFFIDNVVQPTLIKNKIKLGFIGSFVGVISGLTVFGFIGVFIGPIVIELTRKLYLELLIEKH